MGIPKESCKLRSAWRKAMRAYSKVVNRLNNKLEIFQRPKFATFQFDKISSKMFEGMLCMKSEDKGTSCHGDVGGPLVARDKGGAYEVMY